MDEFNNSSTEMSVNMCQSLVSSCASLSSANTALNLGVIKIRVLIHALIKHYILYTARTAPDFPVDRRGWWWGQPSGVTERRLFPSSLYIHIYKYKIYFPPIKTLYTHITNSNNHNNTYDVFL